MGFLNEVLRQTFGTDFKPKKSKKKKKDPVRIYHYYGKPIVAIEGNKVHYLTKKKPRR